MRQRLPDDHLLVSQVEGFYYDSTDDDVYTQTRTSIVVSNMSGTVLDSFPIPSTTTTGAALQQGNANGSVLVHPNGNIYFFMLQSTGTTRYS